MRHYCLQIVVLLIFMMSTAPASARTLVVEGKLDGSVMVKKHVTFSADQSLTQFTYQFSVPSIYNSAGNVQRLDDFRVVTTPLPTETKETVDRFGNRSQRLVWHKLQGDVQVAISYSTGITAVISPRISRTPFPLKSVPEEEQVFLKSSKLAQSDAPKIIEMAGQLTAGALTEHQAVNSILSHVSDAIKYQYNPKQYDALFALTTGSGNCQNFSHLAVALLRAAGIPARVSIGQTLKDKWKIPMDKTGSSLVQGMGEGLHAWIEVWYPDQGWLPCDPQQSRLFTSTRHIKFGHGLDASDVLEYWSAIPVAPRMSENLEARYATDTVDLLLRESLDTPSAYILAGPVTAVAAIREEQTAGPKLPPPVVPLIPAPMPAKITPKPLPAPPKPGSPLEIGNRDFPSLVEMYQVDGNVGRRSFDRETAEYATSKHLYAQAFTLDAPLILSNVSLAMRKFGGDGTVYIDVVRDNGGKPSLDGVRSLPVALEKITRKPGYYWVDFTVPGQTKLQPGKYWLILRHSGEAIMNWFYTPGKRVNGPDDSRSTVQGWQWEDVLSGEFVYRVRGKVSR